MGGGDPDAGGGDAVPRPVIGEGGKVAGAVGCRDAHHAGVGGRVEGLGRGVVAGRGHDDGVPGEAVVDGVPDHGAVGGSTEGHVDDVGAPVCGPPDPLGEIRVEPYALRVEHLDGEDPGLPCRTRDTQAVVGLGCSGPGHHRAVPIVIVGRAVSVHKVVAGQDSGLPTGSVAGQVGVVEVDPRVEDGDGDRVRTGVAVPGAGHAQGVEIALASAGEAGIVGRGGGFPAVVGLGGLHALLTLEPSNDFCRGLPRGRDQRVTRLAYRLQHPPARTRCHRLGGPVRDPGPEPHDHGAGVRSRPVGTLLGARRHLRTRWLPGSRRL